MTKSCGAPSREVPRTAPRELAAAAGGWDEGSRDIPNSVQERLDRFDRSAARLAVRIAASSELRVRWHALIDKQWTTKRAPSSPELASLGCRLVPISSRHFVVHLPSSGGALTG
jgi:hypothetical protein